MMLLHTLQEEVALLIDEGGWVFLSLIALAFGIAFALLSLWQAMARPEGSGLDSTEWLRLLHDRKGSGEVREKLARHLDHFTDKQRKLDEIGEQLFSKPVRRFPFAFILISAAPLIGLLGTVSGMFTTFRGMSLSSAATPLDIISDGISEALITTQTGLMIGVPTYIVCGLLKSRHENLVLQFQRIQSQLLQPSRHGA